MKHFIMTLPYSFFPYIVKKYDVALFLFNSGIDIYIIIR